LAGFVNLVVSGELVIQGKGGVCWIIVCTAGNRKLGGKGSSEKVQKAIAFLALSRRISSSLLEQKGKGRDSSPPSAVQNDKGKAVAFSNS